MGTREVTATEFRAKCPRIIREMADDGRPVVVTRHGRPVALLSPLPQSAAPSFVGWLQGTVLAYERPNAPAASPDDWSALR